MKKLFLLAFFLILSCGGDSDNENAISDDSKSDFPNYIDSNNLRIFAREGVTEKFLNNVGLTYNEMFMDNSNINSSMRSQFITTCKEKYVYQRVGVDGMANNSNFDSGTPPKPYGDNATDYIWEMKTGGSDQLGEVIEHLLHTVTAVGLYLTFNDWNYKNTSSQLYLAMNEAIDKGIYDISSYNNLKSDDAYQRIITQEYAYWLILAEWDLYVATGKKDNGMTGNGEFTIGTPSEIQSRLPIGHKLYKDYIEKIFSIPEKDKLSVLFP